MSRALLLLSYLSFTAAAVYAGCTLPSVPSKIPDGSTASDEEVRMMMIAMSHFETDVNNYLKCLAFELSQERLSTQTEKNLRGEALERHQTVVARFNTQMRLYMSR